MPPRRKVAKKGSAKVKKPEVVLPSDASELASVLGMVATPNDEVIRQGVRILRKFIEAPQCLPALMQQLTESTSSHARQLSAILLAKCLPRHWGKFPVDMKNMVHAALLQTLSTEANRNVRNSVVHVIVRAAIEDLPKNAWPELLPFIWAGASSEKEVEQEYTMFLLSRLMKRAPGAIEPHKAEAKRMCVHFIDTPYASVRHHAIGALNMAFTRYLEADEIDLVGNVVARLVAMIHPVIESGDDESLTEIFGVIFNASGPMIPMADDTLRETWSLMVGMLTSTDMDMPHREKAMSMIVQILRTRPGRVTSLGLAAPAVEAVCKLLPEPWGDVESLFGNPDDATAQSVGIDLCNIMAATLPKDAVFAAFLPYMTSYLQSANELERKAGLILFAAMANGCPDELMACESGAAAQQMLTHCCALVNDPSPLVRVAAYICVVNVCEVLNDLMPSVRAQLFPSLLPVPVDASVHPLLRRKACLALESLTSCLSTEDVTEFAPGLMQLVMQVLHSPDIEMIVMALGVARVVAERLAEGFLPYFSTALEASQPWMFREEEELLLVRARATESVGVMAAAVGVSNWPDSVPLLFKVVLAGFVLDAPDVHDASFSFFRHVIAAWGSEVPLEVASPVLELCAAVLESADGFDFDDDDEGGLAGLEDSSDDDDDGDDGRRGGSARSNGGDAADRAIAKLAAANDDGAEETAVGGEGIEGYDPIDTDDLKANVPALEAKIEAMRVTQQCLETLGTRFPNEILEAILTSCGEIMNLPYTGLRTAVLETFGAVAEWMGQHYPLSPVPVRGTASELSDAHAGVLIPLMGGVCESIIIESDPTVVIAAMNTLATMLDNFGMAMLPENDPSDEEDGQVLRDLFLVLSDIAKEDSACQIEKELNDITSTNNLSVIAGYCNLLGSLANAMGTHFLEFFSSILPDLTQFLDPRRPIRFRTGVLGSIAEIVEKMGPADHPHEQQLAEIALSFFVDPIMDLRRHACFLAGALASASRGRCGGKTVELIQGALSVVAAAKAVPSTAGVRTDDIIEAAGALDNAVSSLIKIVVAVHEAGGAAASEALPLGDVLPAIAGNLAFRDDYEEMNIMVPFLPRLWEVSPAFFQANLPKVVFAAGEMLQAAELDSKAREMLVAWMKYLSEQMPGQVEQIVAALDAPAQECFVKHMQA